MGISLTALLFVYGCSSKEPLPAPTPPPPPPPKDHKTSIVYEGFKIEFNEGKKTISIVCSEESDIELFLKRSDTSQKLIGKEGHTIALLTYAQEDGWELTSKECLLQPGEASDGDKVTIISYFKQK
jgi:hypothetical protein